MQSKSFDAWIDRARLLHDGGDLNEILACYSNALGIKPDSVDANLGLGYVLMRMGQYEKAINVYRTTLRLDPFNVFAHHDMGEAYQNMGCLPEAEICYLAARDLRPELLKPHLNLGRVYMKEGRLNDAIESFNTALGLKPGSGIAHHNLGLCLYDDRHLEVAAREFRMAVDLDPSNALASCFYGIINSQLGKEEIAEYCYRHARDLTPFAVCIIESFAYMRSHGTGARYFSSTPEMLKFGVAAATGGGMFLEFGVYNGASISLIAGYRGTIIHGFDSFEGLPEEWHVGSPTGRPYESAGSYSTGGRLPKVPENVILHIGTFADSLPGFLKDHPESVSFINIDCDLYRSTRTIFTQLSDRILPGTVIVFDEYLCYPDWRQGEYRAFQEFVTDHGLDYEYLAFSFFTGQAVVKILDKPGRSLR